MSNDFDPTKKNGDFISKEAYTKQYKKIRKVLDGREGVYVTKEEPINMYDKRAHQDAVRKAMSDGFKEIDDARKKEANIPNTVEIGEDETYHGIPINELPPLLKIEYGMKKASKQGQDPIDDPSDS